MSHSLTGTVSTKIQVFPAGTVDSPFTFTLTNASGSVVATLDTAETSAVFNDVTAGDFVITVTKNGISASATVSIPEDAVKIQVPDTLVITVA